MKFYIAFFFCLPLFAWAQKEDSTRKTLKKDTTIVLDAVSVNYKKPMLKRKADRLEFNIDQTPLQNLNGWDILKNTPNVVVKNDELSVRGSTQILVTINDKKILMSQEQLKQFLENTKGSSINSVEVITNPPAKYEAQGGAVINIKMKQNKLTGYKGRLSGRYHQSIYAKGRIGLMQSFNTDKWQLSGDYNFVSGNYVRKNLDVVTFADDQTRWESDMVRKTQSHAQHSYNFSAQYAIDTLQNIQFGFDGNYNPASIGNYNVPTNIYNTANNALESNYQTLNDRRQRYGRFNAYLAYDKKFGAHNLTWSNNYSTNHHRENQEVATYFRFINEPERYNRFANHSLQLIDLYASQLDYRLNQKKLTFESGLKYSFVSNQNDLSFFDGNQQNLVLDPNRSNLFKYRENIFAAYASVNYQWGKWEAKAGLRTETTLIQTVSNQPFVENKNTRTNLFPTLYLMHNLGKDQQLGFSYGKRINRPNYDFLNPSKSYYNFYSYFQGDANLKSTIIHNLSTTYTLKDWNFEIYYSHRVNPSMEISVQNPATFETVYNYTNIEKSNNFGANFSKGFSLSEKWKVNLYAMGEYNDDYFIGVDKVLYKNKNFFYYGNVSTQITLDKAKTWDLNLLYVYNSKSIQGSFNITSSQNTNVVLNKKMFDKKFEIGLVINDIFKTDNSIVSAKYANQNQYFTDYRDTQYFMINLKYNFGNQKVKDAKARAKTDEQNRM
ncbi:outer membrane beta-barrel family protein [Pedobacter xixiisoli]|uniref:Outer membrane protein beta-barrel family protein n=1 Tax=Pedobacter xixiisoli TaxID=1476464 RepID=A0A285ZYS0_9SPHI|nr:outer membrane beta-barrel family protein [Pedobacter xixiisoli]SOD14779.1 Outer membrane protein beta-barrel family protein [Pedobacter xixiisoli]